MRGGHTWMLLLLALLALLLVGVSAYDTVEDAVLEFDEVEDLEDEDMEEGEDTDLSVEDDEEEGEELEDDFADDDDDLEEEEQEEVDFFVETEDNNNKNQKKAEAKVSPAVAAVQKNVEEVGKKKDTAVKRVAAEVEAKVSSINKKANAVLLDITKQGQNKNLSVEDKKKLAEQADRVKSAKDSAVKRVQAEGKKISEKITKGASFAQRKFQKISNLTKAIEDAKAAQEKSKTAAEGAIKKVTESSKSAVEKVKKEFGDKIKNLEDGIAKNKKVIQSAQEAIKKAENDVEQARKDRTKRLKELESALAKRRSKLQDAQGKAAQKGNRRIQKLQDDISKEYNKLYKNPQMNKAEKVIDTLHLNTGSDKNGVKDDFEKRKEEQKAAKRKEKVRNTLNRVSGEVSNFLRRAKSSGKDLKEARVSASKQVRENENSGQQQQQQQQQQPKQQQQQQPQEQKPENRQAYLTMNDMMRTVLDEERALDLEEDDDFMFSLTD